MGNETKSYKAELVGVFGYPVAENPTIVMQEAAFQALGLNWRYLTIEVRPEQLADAVRGLRAFNMAGINLTIPHKVAVIPHLDGLAPGEFVLDARRMSLRCRAVLRIDPTAPAFTDLGEVACAPSP